MKKYTQEELDQELKNGVRDFSRASYGSKNFNTKDLKGANFAHSKLMNANFAGADLTGANFEYADLYGANFIACNLTNANFKGAQLQNLQIKHCNFTGASFIEAKFEEYSSNPFRTVDKLQGVILEKVEIFPGWVLTKKEGITDE
jgi:uncharacterized protein YjbI with pentapeptide repeats